jgi:phosphoribosylaminoimidazolecarboxamide formyltransferase/IMP cyclohydrolase
LAGEAFAHTAAYDGVIAAYFARQSDELFPQQLSIPLVRSATLRYGENSHQQAAVYKQAGVSSAGLVTASQLNGKELSYNNLLDLDSALAIVRGFSHPAATVIKHNNPCGAAVAETLSEAARKALDGDPQSAFGGVIGFNRAVDKATAELLATPGLFIEAIVAPAFDDEALRILTSKPKWKANVRLMATGTLDKPQSVLQFRYIEGGMLVQQGDTRPDPEGEWKIVTEASPAGELMDDLRFGWGIVRHVKSNAIILAKSGSLIGCGAGQMSRVDSVDIAIQKAAERAKGSILASDAFFPFPDSIEKAAAAGIAAVIQPGGSVKDADDIAACNQHGIPMIFTGRRHFKH